MDMLSIYNYINLDIYLYIYVCRLPVRILLVGGHPVMVRDLLVRDRLVQDPPDERSGSSL